MSDWKDNLRDSLGIDRQEDIWDWTIDEEVDIIVMDSDMDKEMIQWCWGDEDKNAEIKVFKTTEKPRVEDINVKDYYIESMIAYLDRLGSV